MTFRDHFSHGAPGYAAFRPRYPDALLRTLAEHAPGRALAWDAGTGSGQAAVGLARHFARVVATDASAAQLSAAQPHERVEYRIAPAESSGLADASTHLVAAAQALHWFDIPAFWREAERVLVSGGILAVWCYGILQIDRVIDPILARFYHHTVGPFWPSERALVDSGYRTIDFPLPEIDLPPFAIERALTLPEVLGYVATWSAVHRYVEARGSDPIPALAEELAEHWGPAHRPRPGRWPLHIRAGRR